jgi:hypothetical protein
MNDNPNIIINIKKQIVISFAEKIFFILPVYSGIKLIEPQWFFQNYNNNKLIKAKFIVISRKNFILFTVNNYKYSYYDDFTE